MKQKDITLILVVIFISAILSFGISSVFITSPKRRAVKVEVVESIKRDFPPPDEKYFNQQSINPTQLITIGKDANPTPFNNQKP